MTGDTFYIFYHFINHAMVRVDFDYATSVWSLYQQKYIDVIVN